MKKYAIVALLCTFSNFISAQAWQSQANVPEDLAFPIVVALRGNIHVIGGGAFAGASDVHFRYTPSTNTWDTLPPVPYLAQQAAGAVINDRIHICGGGYPTSGQRLDKHYYFDPDSVQWYPAASLPVAIAIHEAVSFDGKLWCLSGQPNKSLCEYYDPAANQWYQKNALPDQNFWYGALVSTGSAMYRFGGGAYFSPTAAANRYNPATDTWIPLPPIPQPLHAVAAAAFNDSLIFLSGGFGLSAETAQVWIYNTNAQTYTPYDSLPVARSYHGMVRIDSCIYSVGGYHANIAGLPYSLIKSCFAFTPTAVSLAQPAKPYTVVATPGRLQISLYATVKAAGITIHDASGRVFLRKRIGNEAVITPDNLAPGLYLVCVEADGWAFVEKWMVNK